MTKLPQVLVNVRVADRDALATASAVWEAVESESAELAGRGRVLVRPSGTEPVVRVMVEAPTQEHCEAVCARVVAVVERELGPGAERHEIGSRRVIQPSDSPRRTRDS